MSSDHDPLCLEPECERSCVGWCEGEDGTHYCQCQLIARVRADEREQAAQRIDGHSQHGYRCACGADLNNYEHHLQNVIRGEA